MSCFQNLSKALYDTFAASVQSEDELIYPSATLILAGLLQIHARTPQYASYKARLESYPTQVCTKDSKSPVPSSSELASAGFFHTGSGDETVCPSCGLGLRDWQATDQPEACHIAYSTAATTTLEMSTSEDQSNIVPTPAFPCLYLAVHRLLVSELPLARKSLVPVGPIQSIRGLPGVISRLTVHFTDSDCRDSYIEYPSLVDRLRAIAKIMSSPPAPQGWPVENARALGHSDDLIVLALWRLQAEAAGMDLACPSMESIHLDSHATAELLRAILRVQEGFDAFVRDNFGSHADNLDNDDWETRDSTSEGSENDMTAEDVETAALSRCRSLRLPHLAIDSTSPHSIDSYERHVKRIRLPRFYQFLVWWSNRWSLDV